LKTLCYPLENVQKALKREDTRKDIFDAYFHGMTLLPKRKERTMSRTEHERAFLWIKTDLDSSSIFFMTAIPTLQHICHLNMHWK
ncbi:hypothetical protein EK904_015011, partial [Melospiza melodia maxima]